MLYTKTDSGDFREIAFSDSITYADRQVFINLVEKFVSSNQQTLILNFAETTFIDSAGLGFILITLQLTQNCNKKLVIKQPRNQVKDAFFNMNFDSILTIELDE